MDTGLIYELFGMVEVNCHADLANLVSDHLVLPLFGRGRRRHFKTKDAKSIRNASLPMLRITSSRPPKGNDQTKFQIGLTGSNLPS
jgi:hypothetical protein